MDWEKDQAQKCIKIAKDALAIGNVERAKKFLNKSLTLCRSDEAEGKNVALSACHIRD